MASQGTFTGLSGKAAPSPVEAGNAALQQAPWPSPNRLSRLRLAELADSVERFLEGAGFDRAPWLAVGLAGGIALWFWLDNPREWRALIALMAGICLLAGAASGLGAGRWPRLCRSVMAMAAALVCGCGLVWAKSELVGTAPIAHPMASVFVARVLDRYEEPAFNDVRLTLATREPRTERAIRIHVRVGARDDRPGVVEGAVVRLRARLMPPMPPCLPGGRDMAREAWFSGLAASGTAVGAVEVITPARDDNWIARARHFLADHVRRAVPGSHGGIAVTLVSGNRATIDASDQQAMRDAGLTHLLAISGLHVSAVVAGAWFLAFRLLTLVPGLALRVRVPVVASACGAATGVAYTLLTGMHLPTVRACAGALLALGAVALGRQVLSLRLLALAAGAVMLMWPEEVIGPSFQLSFGSVIAIIAIHDAAPVRAFLRGHADNWWRGILRHAAMLVLSGMVIDLALMPIALFHFHRAGIYGSVANLVAIPLITFLTMPLIAAGLVLDLVGAGWPAWWLCARSLDFLLGFTHWLVSRPGAVSIVPTMGQGAFVLFVAGMLWLGLWHGRARLWGLAPALVAAAMLALLRPVDVLIAGDGRNIGITSPDGGRLMVLRLGKSDYERESLLEAAGMTGEVRPLVEWPGAHCNPAFCLVEASRGGRVWRILAARGKVRSSDAALAEACAGVDIVVARDKLYGPCRPALLKADREMLMRTGGIALDLVNRRVVTVADSEGQHPWWRAPRRLPSPIVDQAFEDGGSDDGKPEPSEKDRPAA